MSKENKKKDHPIIGNNPHGYRPGTRHPNSQLSGSYDDCIEALKRESKLSKARRERNHTL